MASVEFSRHALEMMRQRAIPEEWVIRALDIPDRTDHPPDGTIHYIKAIPEHGGRFLRVVINPTTRPKRVVTVFFDRRLSPS